MPVIFQKRIDRTDAIRNPDVLYVFGDNLIRKGLGGQAAALRGEKNAVGVATKKSPTINGVFGETTLEIIAQKRAIDTDMKPLFEHVLDGGVVVWPSDGIGTGLARLQDFAPTTLEYIEKKLTALIRVGKLHARLRFAQAENEAEEHL